MFINTDPSSLEARIKELLQEAAQLKHTSRQRRAKKAHRRERRPRTPTSVLAPGHRLTTIPGSLYDTALRVMADRGKLVLHQHLFTEKVRGVAYIETSYLRGEKIDPQDLAAIRAILDKKVESQKGRPWYGYVKGQCDNYIKFKPQLAPKQAQCSRRAAG